MPGIDELLEAVSRVDARPFRVSMVRDDAKQIVHDDLGDAAVVERRTFEGRAVTTELELGASTDPGDSELFPLVDTVIDHIARTADLLSERERELRDRREEIELLTFISRTLGSVIQLDEAASAILGKLVDVTGADRATLWSHDPESEELRLLASKGRADPVVRSVTLEHPESLVAHVWRGQQPILAGPESAAMAGLSPSVRSGFEGRALLAVPVTYAPPRGEPRRVGVLNLVGGAGEPSFRAADRELVAAIASQVGAALENGRLVREELARERFRAELDLAHDLQLRLLPDPDDFGDLFDVAAQCDPADSVGGDFYQLVRLPGGRLGVLLGDVSSHGVSAALVMAQLVSAASLVAPLAGRPGTVLRRLRDQVAPELEAAGMLVTVFYGVLDRSEGTLCYASAGHPHAFLLSGDAADRLGALDRPIGAPGDTRFRDREVRIEPGDRLLLFTDGLFEGGEQSGAEEERGVVRAAASAADGTAGDALEAALDHAADKPSGDDRTALVVRI